MSGLLTLSLPGAAPEDAESLRTRATKHYRAKKLAEACPLFERAAQLAPEHGPALADLGLCLQKQGRQEQALPIFLRAPTSTATSSRSTT